MPDSWIGVAVERGVSSNSKKNGRVLNVEDSIRMTIRQYTRLGAIIQHLV